MRIQTWTTGSETEPSDVPHSSGGPGAVIILTPGTSVSITCRDQLLEIGGFIRYAGPMQPGDLPGFEVLPQPSADCLNQSNGYTIRLNGCLPTIQLPVGSIPGQVYIPVTHALVFIGGWPPQMGASGSVMSARVLPNQATGE